nr:MAG TPA: hypothetical protein [Caudoviricetes sp.]
MPPPFLRKNHKPCFNPHAFIPYDAEGVTERGLRRGEKPLSNKEYVSIQQLFSRQADYSTSPGDVSRAFCALRAAAFLRVLSRMRRVIASGAQLEQYFCEPLETEKSWPQTAQ